MARAKRTGPGGNIVLIGFMGSGKSQAGRRLARDTNRTFIDTDDLVEADGLSIPDIFASEGEAGFRRRERRAVAQACKARGAVIATGGGAVLSPDNVKALKQSGVLVYLQAPAAELSDRLASTEGRPLLESRMEQRNDPARKQRVIKSLLDERLPVYESVADVIIDTAGRDVGQVVKDVLRRIEVQSRRTAKVQSVEVGVEPPYKVFVGRGLLRRASALVPVPSTAEKACIVSHPRVVRLWGGALEEGLRASKLDTMRLTFPEGEERKTLETAGRLYRRLAAVRFHRSDVVIALGGGVVGDLAGFVASTYARGIPVIQAPTTLLAMVDAAIGGKTGFNLPEGKNLVGTFYHPDAVLCDLDTLKTLPEREYRGGLAEVIKYALIADPDLGSDLVGHRGAIMERDDVLQDIVLRCAGIKACVVASDERESGQRMFLNYGHTLGHALERLGIRGAAQSSKSPALHHGEAISIGMVFAARLSVLLGFATKDLVEEHLRLFRAFGLPTKPERVTWQGMRPYVEVDKKYSKGVRFVLLEDLGKPFIQGDIPESAIEAALRQVTES